MSDTIWVDVQGRSKNELPSDNTIILLLKTELDAFCKEMGVTPLSSFYDYSELTANYGNEVDATNGQGQGSWFEPAPAIKTVQAISAHLSRRPEMLDFSHDPRRKHWRATLIRELQNCESTLQEAVSTNRRFRLLIVP